ncbi:MAG: hypothetical protein LBS14_03055 [Holosporaceae bacterium]|jgi:hypothetical protein|nr:hypothetical protein [Holosporaceae bacterium]
MNVKIEEKKPFSIEDVVSHSNIEITNANDNRPPTRLVLVRGAVWLVIAALVVALLSLK